MASSEDYWLKRARIKAFMLYRSVDECENELRSLYEESLQDMQKQIAFFYSKYARENNVTYAEAVKILTSDEYKVFKRDITDYIDEIEALGETTEQAQELLKEPTNRIACCA